MLDPAQAGMLHYVGMSFFSAFFSVPRGKRPPRLRLEAHTKGFGPRDTDCGGHVQGADVCQS